MTYKEWYELYGKDYKTKQDEILKKKKEREKDKKKREKEQGEKQQEKEEKAKAITENKEVKESNKNNISSVSKSNNKNIDGNISTVDKFGENGLPKVGNNDIIKNKKVGATIKELEKVKEKRQQELLNNKNKILPNADSVVIKDEKFTKYLFDESKKDGYAKGKAFESRLGYSIKNWELLRNEVKKLTSLYPSKFLNNNGHGDRYEQKLILDGLNGTPANVVIGWLVNDESTHLASMYIKELGVNEYDD